MVRRARRGETLVSADQACEVGVSPAHGDAQAVLRAIERFGVRALLAAGRCRESDVVIGMMAARVIAPHATRATTRWWRTHTLAEDLGRAAAAEAARRAAMDWLRERQGAIGKRLARRHLADGALALYDVSSSDVAGTRCPLAKLGHNRDGRRGKGQVNGGLRTNRRGIPVAG